MPDQATPRLCLFGLPRVEAGDIQLDRFPTRRCVLILARLAIAHQRRMSRAQLAEVLWPDEPYEATRQRMRQELSRLRLALGPFDQLLETTAESVRLDLTEVQLDVDEFERLIRTAKHSIEPAQRQSLLRRIVEMASARFMSGSTESWIEVERMRLDVVRYGAMVDLGNLLLESDHPDEAMRFAQEAIEVAPERESAHLLLVSALRDLGHFESAVAHFRAFRLAMTTKHGVRLSAHAERIGAEIEQPVAIVQEAPMGLSFSLPAPSEPIYGRDETIAQVVDLLIPTGGNSRLVTVLGVGGMGKTHLILYTCRELSSAFGERVAYIDLSNLENAELIPSAILASLGLGYVPTKNPIDSLKAILSKGELVLALDNLEQFGSSAAQVVRLLLDEIPTLRVLAGSRIPLNLAGEVRINLGPLSIPSESARENEATTSAALHLFLSLTGTLQTSTRFRPDEWATISNIVRRLEGVPLGMQLAASRMRAIGPKALLRTLDQGLSVLTNARADAPERHRTLRNAVAGSVDQLEPSVQQALFALSIFRGGWTLDAAETLCGIQDASLTMELLADASLITILNDGQQIRFRMLETIREYSVSLLTEQQIAELRRSFVSWMVERSRLVAVDLIDGTALTEIDSLELEIDNLREALRYSLEEFPESAFELGANLGSFLLFRTSGYEAYQFYTELFARYGSLPVGLSMLRSSYGHSLIAHFVQASDMGDIYDRTLRLGHAISDRSLEIKTLVLQAFRAQNNIQYAECRGFLSEIDAFASEFGWFESEGFADRVKSRFALYQGELESSIGHLRSAVSWFSARGELFFQSLCRRDLAAAAIDLGDVDLARANLAGLLQQAREIRYFMLIPAIHRIEGLVALREQNYLEALRSFQIGLAGRSELGVKFHEAEQWNVIGRTYLEMGQLPDAKVAFTNAAKMWLAEGLPVSSAIAVTGLAAVSHQEGQLARAVRILLCASDVIESAGAKLMRFETKFANNLQSELRRTDLFTEHLTNELTLDEAIRLGSISTPAH